MVVGVEYVFVESKDGVLGVVEQSVWQMCPVGGRSMNGRGAIVGWSGRVIAKYVSVLSRASQWAAVAPTPRHRACVHSRLHLDRCQASTLSQNIYLDYLGPALPAMKKTN